MAYTGDTLSDLNSAEPTGTEPVANLDEAVRQIKRVLKNSGTGGLLAVCHPVGSIYSSTTDVDPATTLGFGTWLKLEGVFVVGHKSGDAEFGTVTANQNSADGGAKTHTLTESEMPAHTHDIRHRARDDDNSSTEISGEGSGGTVTSDTESTGGGQPHNNLPPYKTVYLWERTA